MDAHLFILRDPSQGYYCKYDRIGFIRTTVQACYSVGVQLPAARRCLLHLWPRARPAPRPHLFLDTIPICFCFHVGTTTRRNVTVQWGTDLEIDCQGQSRCRLLMLPFHLVVMTIMMMYIIEMLINCQYDFIENSLFSVETKLCQTLKWKKHINSVHTFTDRPTMNSLTRPEMRIAKYSEKHKLRQKDRVLSFCILNYSRKLTNCYLTVYTSAKTELCDHVGLSVCLSVCRITAKVISRFHWNLVLWLGLRRTD